MSIIAAEEGGIPALYSPRHFIPTLLVSALRPALRLFSNHMITETLNINTTFNPILYRICQAGLLAVETAVLAPLELGRRRLMAQPVPHRRRRLIPVTENVAAQEKISDPSYPTVVKMPVQPYAGILDVWLRVTREEGGQGTGVFGTAKSFWKGYAGLYKGFWPMFATAFVRMVVEEAEKVNSEYAFSWSG